MAAEQAQSRIAHSPGTIAAQFAADQVCRLLWRRQVPVKVKVEQAERVREAGGDELFTAI